MWGIPNIIARDITVGEERWILRVDDLFADLLANVTFPLSVDRPFLERRVVSGVPLLFGFFPPEKTVLVVSINASRELFLLEGFTNDPAAREMVERDSEARDRLTRLQRHVNKLRLICPEKGPTHVERLTKCFELPDLLRNGVPQDIQREALRLANELRGQLKLHRPSIVEKVSDIFLDAAVDHPLLRVELLKLIAALPSLDHDRAGKEIKRLTLETLKRLKGIPLWMQLLFGVSRMVVWWCPALLAAGSIRGLVRHFAHRFIAGESIEKAAPKLHSLFASGRDVTLDQLGELVVSKCEADYYADEVVKLIRGWSLFVRKGERNRAGIQRAHISIKVSALTHEFKPQAFEHTYGQVAPRLKKILLEAKTSNVFINIDAEHYSVRNLTVEILRKLVRETVEFHGWDGIGVVLQAYVRDAADHLNDLLAFARERRVRLPVRLVKGAYWDTETIEAEAYNFEAPQFLNKEETDLHARQLVMKILEHHEQLQLCFGSHNLEDHCFAESVRARCFSQAPIIEHQCLHGTFEALSLGMTRMGWVVRNYIPVGNLLVGMAYLVRRIMENASQVGVLAWSRMTDAQATPPPEVLLREKIASGKLVVDPAVDILTPEFRNTAPLRLDRSDEYQAMVAALNGMRSHAGRKFEVDRPWQGPAHQVTSPSDPTLVVGTISFATRNDVEQVIKDFREEAHTGEWPRWRPFLRAAIIVEGAARMVRQRTELAALMVFEGGKSPSEALCDVDEAIDFLNFYARVETDYASARPVVPRGVAAVISPWNFPLAIPCGMVAGSLVAGNCVALKSAEPTPLIAQRLVDLLHEAGVPRNALVHIPGHGREVGQTLVSSPDVSTVVFTGSEEVGTRIAQTVGSRLCRPPLSPDVVVPAKAITEMGGKNAIIITKNAELDETIAGVLYSAFGNAGQKCSAASRLIVDQAIVDHCIERLGAACRDITVGPSWDFATTVNPIINMKEKNRLHEEAREVRQEAYAFGGKVVLDRTEEDLPGCCLGPLVVLLPASRAMHRESFAMRELFGPILHLIPYRTLDQAVEIANAVKYGLTGGIFSQSQNDIDAVLAHMEAGNLYVNRSITGARVAIEPFGGFKHSGTGPKAGCRQYVEAFHLTGSGIRSPGSGVRDPERFFQIPDPGFLIPDFKYPRPNRPIPGQVSYDDYRLIKERGVVVACLEEITPQAFRFALSADAVGSRVTVLARTRKVLGVWEEAKKRTGASWTCQLVSQQEFEWLVSDVEASYVIVDGEEYHLREVFTVIAAHRREGKHLRTILSPGDGPLPSDCEASAAPFILVRSVAINTMRYGAPLVANNGRESYDNDTGSLGMRQHGFGDRQGIRSKGEKCSADLVRSRRATGKNIGRSSRCEGREDAGRNPAV